MVSVGEGISDEEKTALSSKESEMDTQKNIINGNGAFSYITNGQKDKAEENKTEKTEADKTDKVYNCYTCNIQIYNHTFLRYHFKTEWHKYNLKRKLLNLGCVDEITFNKKVANLNKMQEETNKKKKGKELDNNTAKKKKEKKNEKKNIINTMNLSLNVEVEKLKKYATPEKELLEKNVPYRNPLVCFFDNRIFSTIEENREHMKKEYTFSLPDEKYVTNLRKIYLIIGKAIYDDNICIYCFKHFRCVKSAQMHMICNGHTKIDNRFVLFIEKYYDFTKTYVDLINQYIQTKEDKEQILHIIDTIQKEKMHRKQKVKYKTHKKIFHNGEESLQEEEEEEEEEEKEKEKDKEEEEETEEKEEKEKDKEEKEETEEKEEKEKEKVEEKEKEKEEVEKKEKMEEKEVEEKEQNDSVVYVKECKEDAQENLKKPDGGIFIDETENTHDKNFSVCSPNAYSDGTKKRKTKREKKRGQRNKNPCNLEMILYNNEETELNKCHDFKITEQELNKNINSDVIYEALEYFGYNRPEMNEYNNLILPDGSEAVNRKYAYLFQQDHSILNRSNNEIVLQTLEIEKNNNNNNNYKMDYKQMKYYKEYIKKFQLDISVKANKLNKFMKTESICFF